MRKFLALDLGGTFLKAAIIDEETNILDKWKISSKCECKEDVLNIIYEAIEPHVKEVDAIAISFPGVVDRDRAFCVTAGAFGDLFNELPLGDILKEKFGLPVAIDNDAKCAINAEIWNGALKDCTNGLVYVIGTGLGGGIEINHQVYRGSNFSSGEISGPMMVYGESYSNNYQICKPLATPGLLNAYKKNAGIEDEIDGETFFDEVNNGNQIAIDTLKKFCAMTATYFFNLQCVLDVDRICVGGGISAQPILLEMLQKELDQIYEDSWELKNKPELVKCHYENDANLIGAVKNFIDLNG